jgi:hypothetical protein
MPTKDTLTLKKIENLFRRVLEEYIEKPTDIVPVELTFDSESANEFEAVRLPYADKLRAALKEQGHDDIANELGTHYLWFNREGLSEDARKQVRNNRNKWFPFFFQDSENQKAAELFRYYHYHNGRGTAKPGNVVALKLDATLEEIVDNIAYQ